MQIGVHFNDPFCEAIDLFRGVTPGPFHLQLPPYTVTNVTDLEVRLLSWFKSQFWLSQDIHHTSLNA